MNRSLPTIWIVGCLAVACGGKTPGASRVVDADESQLADCTFVEKVQGHASDSDPDAATTAKSAAKEKAAAAGATHVRWIVPCCSYVEGDAYKCDLPDS